MADAENEDEPIDLNVKTIDSNVYKLKGLVIKDQSVESLQGLVKDATGIEEDRQRLIYRGRVLERSTSLSEYKLAHDTVLHLIARPENFRELQAQAEASTSFASSAPSSSMGLFDRGTSMGNQNRGSEGENVDLATPSTGSNTRQQVPDSQSEAVEVLWQGLVSLNTLLSVTSDRESNEAPQVRAAAGDILGGVESPNHTEEAADISVLELATNGEESGNAVEQECSEETSQLREAPSTPQQPSTSSSREDAMVTPEGMENYASDVQFFVGQWLDVKDTVAQWLEATVMEVDTERRRLFVHYNGWPVRWDEWLDFDSNRIAPFRSITRHSSQNGYQSPSPLTFVQSAPRTGPSDPRLLLPEIAVMLRRIQPLIDEAAGIVQEAVDSGHITCSETDWSSPMEGNVAWTSLARLVSPENGRKILYLMISRR